MTETVSHETTDVTARTRVAVRWRDYDPLGHVNSVVFLTYLEEGRTTWLRDVLDEAITGDQWVVAHIELDYLAEIPAGLDHVETEHRVVRVGESSVTFEETLFGESGVTVARGRTVIVMWQPELHASRALSDRERRALLACLSPSESTAP